MRRAIITVGLGFGDEGKGATIDFLSRLYEADLVIRYCGGSQAGHNVELADGRRHTFSQFGAGTVAPCRPRTYLGPNVIIDPLALVREADHLQELGIANPSQLLVLHPSCLVSTVWHRTLNRVRELARGKDKHGSCGMGIGEARRYWLRYGHDAVFARDLGDATVLREKVELLRQRCLLELQELLAPLDTEAAKELDLWELSTEAVARQLGTLPPGGLELATEPPSCRTALFEGAQGVVLDEYRGFHPYTTWSTVTPHHAWELVRQMDVDAVAVLGITRAYATRHGEGPFPTYCPELTARLQDPGNRWNPWQGSLRCGWLDLPLLRYAALAAGPLDGIVVNHLDQVRGPAVSLCQAYENVSLTCSPIPSLAWQERLGEQLRQATAVLRPTTAEDIVARLAEIAPVVLTGFGPTHEQRTFAGIRFRTRQPAR
jgi:adenylosuccinate synthase